MSTIIDSGNIAEMNDIEDCDDLSDMTVTTEADPTTMDFHVQMRGYTMGDFEDMVVHAAAKQLVSGRTFAKEIKKTTLAMMNERVAEEMTEATNEIMSNVAFMRGKEPVTIGEMIGLDTKDYLTQKVNRSGELDNGWDVRETTPRVQYIASQFIRNHFKKEMDAAFKDAMRELLGEVRGQIKAAIDAERAKVSEALANAAK